MQVIDRNTRKHCRTLPKRNERAYGLMRCGRVKPDKKEPRKPKQAGPMNRHLLQQVQLLELQLEVDRLKTILAYIVPLIDPQDTDAAARLRVKSPSTVELRAWAIQCVAPEDVESNPNEWA